MPLQVRPETARDRSAVAAVVEAAFGDAALARLVAELRDEPSYRPARALVADDDGAVVGFVLVTDSTVTAHGAAVVDAHAIGDDPAAGRIATLSPLAVIPERRREGIGTALVSAVVAVCEAEGEPAVVLEGDPRDYCRLGFEPAGRYGLELPVRHGAPPEAGQVRRLRAWTGTPAGAVTYAPPFARLSRRR